MHHPPRVNPAGSAEPNLKPHVHYNYVIAGGCQISRSDSLTYRPQLLIKKVLKPNSIQLNKRVPVVTGHHDLHLKCRKALDKVAKGYIQIWRSLDMHVSGSWRMHTSGPSSPYPVCSISSDMDLLWGSAILGGRGSGGCTCPGYGAFATSSCNEHRWFNPL